MSTVPSVSVTDAAAELGAGGPILIDVREDDELAIASVAGAVHIPLGELPSRVSELEKDGAYIMMCHGGTRSGRATTFLIGEGFTNARNMTGGIAAWSREVDPSIPQY